MKGVGSVEIRIVKDWDIEEIFAIYLTGGMWDERWDPEGIAGMIRGSYCFTIGYDTNRHKAIATGRVISDGASDAYIQDLVVLPEYRSMGVGGAIVEKLVNYCRSHNITWIGLIAEPGTDTFYERLGFSRMADNIPMLYNPET